MLGFVVTHFSRAFRAARPWVLFAAVALVPAVAMAAVAVRATASEEAAIEREATLSLDATARHIGDEVERVETASSRAMREASFDDGDRGVERELARAAPPFADAVGLSAAGAIVIPAPSNRDTERVTEACATLARSYGELVGAARARASEQLRLECPAARGPSGRWLYPLLALEESPPDSARLSAWLVRHGPAMREGERTAFAAELARAAFTDESARAQVEGALLQTSARHASIRTLLEEGLAREIARTKVDAVGIGRVVTAAAFGYVRLLADGRRVAFITHAASLAPALASLAGRPDVRAEIDGIDAIGDTRDLRQRGLRGLLTLTTELRVAVKPSDARDIARRTSYGKRVILFSGALSAALAMGLALYLFAKMRAARRLGELRTDFVAAVSHELRTPVASIRMLAELLYQQKIEPDEAPEVHATLAREARRLGDTVQRLLGFGAMARGKIASSPKREDLSAVVDDAITTFESDYPAMPKVTRRLGSALEADVDAALVCVALHNLLGNALKYAAESAPFEVSLGEANGEVMLTVRDRGPGIAQRDQRRIFEPFERADDRLSHATEGSGIGLSLVRHAARAHGGEVYLTSALGKGATFSIRFPRFRVSKVTRT